MHLVEWKLLYFDSNFPEFCSLGPHWQKVSTGSDYGLAPIRRPTIFWTNDDTVYWGIYVSHRASNLTHLPLVPYICQWTGSSLVQVMACLMPSHYQNQYCFIVNRSIGLLGTSFSEIWIWILFICIHFGHFLSFAFKKMHLKMLSVKMAAILSWGRWVNDSEHWENNRTG